MICYSQASGGSPAPEGEKHLVNRTLRVPRFGKLKILLAVAAAAFLSIPASAAGRRDTAIWNRHMTRGQFLYEAGKYDAAARQLKIALATAEKFGPRDIRLASTLNRLADVYHDQGKYAEAEPLYKRSLVLTRRILGPDHPDVAANLNNLATLYHDEGRYSSAEALYKQALAIVEKRLGPNSPDVAVSLNNLAEVYGEQGKYAEAAPLYKRSLKIWEKALGPHDLNVAVSLNNLGALYDSEQDYPQAEHYYLRALSIKEGVLGPSDPSVALTLSNLGQVYVAERNFKKAQPALYRSLTILHWPLEKSTNPVVGRALTHLGTFYREQGNYTLSEYYYQRAVNFTRKVQGPNSPNLAKSLKSYAILLRKTQRDAQAAKLEAQAAAIGRSRHYTPPPARRRAPRPSSHRRRTRHRN